jgi:hypothetical protein
MRSSSWELPLCRRTSLPDLRQQQTVLSFDKQLSELLLLLPLLLREGYRQLLLLLLLPAHRQAVPCPQQRLWKGRHWHSC